MFIALAAKSDGNFRIDAGAAIARKIVAGKEGEPIEAA
jgi:hypothetical protein